MIGVAKLLRTRPDGLPGTVTSIAADGVNGATVLTISWFNSGTPPAGGNILVRMRDDNLITTWQEQVESTSATESAFNLTPWGYTIRKPTGTTLVTFSFSVTLRDALDNPISFDSANLALWVDVEV